MCNVISCFSVKEIKVLCTLFPIMTMQNEKILLTFCKDSSKLIIL